MKTSFQLLQDLQLGASGRATEAFFALLAKGGSAASVIDQAAGDPAASAAVAAALSAAPGRAVAAYAQAGPSVAAVLRPLLLRMPVSDLWQGMGQALALLTVERDRQPGQALLSLGQAALPTAGPERLVGLTTVALSAVRAGAADVAGQLATEVLMALKSGTPATLDAQSAGQWLEIGSFLLDNLGSSAAVAPMSILALTENTQPAGALLAGILRRTSTRPGSARLVALLQQDLEDIRKLSAALLHQVVGAAVQADASASETRRSRRRGHFAAAIRQLHGLVDDIEAELRSAGGTVGFAVAAPRFGRLCRAAEAKIAATVRDLVAFQPMCVQPVSPRHLASETVLAVRSGLACAGWVISVSHRPDADAGAERVWLDPNLTKGLLRQLVEQITLTSPGRDVSMSLCASSETAVLGEAGAVFELWLKGRLAADGSDDLAAVAESGTVPDILLRLGATVVLRSPDRRSTCLAVRLPGLAPAPEQEPTRSDELARQMVDEFARRREAELSAWGADLALVIHDLAGNLASVSGSAGADSASDVETGREDCADNLTELRYWLTEAEVMLSRMEGREQPYADLAGLARRVLRGLGPTLAAARLQVGQLSATETPRVPIEPVVAAAAIRNLVQEAAKAVPAGSSLAIAISHDRAAGLVDLEIVGPALAGPPPGEELESVAGLLARQGGRLEWPAGGSGRVRARFSLGPGSGLGNGAPAGMTPDVQRAMAAGRVLAAGGDSAAAAHVWSRALSLQAADVLTGLQARHLMPAVGEIAVARGARPKLTPAASRILRGLAGETGAPGLEAATRRMIGGIVAGRLEIGSLTPAELTGLVALLGQRLRLPALESREAAHCLAAALWRAAQVLAQPARWAEQPSPVEELVWEALGQMPSRPA